MKQYSTADSRIWRRCKACSALFYAADPKRTKCIHCKPVGQKELAKLMNYDGAHAVSQRGSVSTMLS